MGARGNSGVITSQIFRGMAEGLGGKSRFNGLDLAHALSRGREDRLRRGRQAGRGDDPDRHPRIGRRRGRRRRTRQRHRDRPRPRRSTRPRSRSPGRRACSRSCARRASSTRAGRGSTGCSRARCSHLVGKSPAGAARDRAHAGAGVKAVHARRPRRRGIRLRDDVPAPAERRRARSTSTRSATTSSRSATPSSWPATRRALKVHVHNERPDLVVGYGLSLGHAQPDQRREPRQPGARRPRDAGRGVHRRGRRSAAARRRQARRSTAPSRGRRVPRWRSSPSSPATASPRSSATSGSPPSSQGGQSANPSTGELLEAIARGRCARGHRPAQQPERRPRRAPGRRGWPTGRSCVVPTRNAAEGFAALLAARPEPRRHGQRRPDDRGRPVDPDARRDRGGPRRDDRRARRSSTARRSRSTRTTGSSRSDGDREAVVLAAVAALTPGFELLTLFYGDGADLDEAETMARRIGAATPGVEVEVRHGGQPFYRYLIAAE